jgi:hypothetical protein
MKKSVLRNTHNVGNAQHSSSVRRVLRTSVNTHSKAITGSVFAALAVINAGCSTVMGRELDPTASAADEVVTASLQVVSEIPDQGGTVISGDAAGADATAVIPAPADEAAALPESTEASPGGANPGAAAPAAGTAALQQSADDVVGTPAPVSRATMQTSGNQLLDTCGYPFVARGVEQIFGEQLPQGNDWVGLVEEIAKSGVNAVRVLASTDTLGTDDIDTLLDVVADHGMVAYLTPYGNEGMRWLEGQDVRAMLARHEKNIIIDAFGEPTFDDRERFIAESTAAIQQVRSWGYRVPLTVTANQFGRDLPSLLELGAQVVASDPLHNTILGWQAYWSQGGYYQETYGLSLTEAVAAISRAPFPIQIGLDHVTDFPASDTADYGTLMSATEAHGVGWLWWDWYNPYGSENNLTEDGTATELTETGRSVLETHAASVDNTTHLVCVR